MRAHTGKFTGLRQIAVALGALWHPAAFEACGVPGADDRNHIQFSSYFKSDTLRFERPVWFGPVPGLPGRYLVMEQGGDIFTIEVGPGGPSRRLFLHVEVEREFNEMGLLGFAFHPRFAENRRYFVNYNPKGQMRTVVEERRAAADFLADGGERGKIVLDIAQPFGNHNGGSLGFDPGGYLVVGMGDGGSGGDPYGNGQNTRTLLGALLRVDVDAPAAGAAYGIPPGNPFADGAGGRPEVWIWGLRNPWKWSFDAVTGELWIGEVGQNKWEEVSVARGGQNLGWNTMEGNHCYPRPGCDTGGLAAPLVELPRNQARSITGGYAYRGDAASPFYGTYIFGDYETRTIWGLRRDAEGRPAITELGTAPGGIAAFAQDEEGNLAMLCFDGVIYKLEL